MDHHRRCVWCEKSACLLVDRPAASEVADMGDVWQGHSYAGHTYPSVVCKLWVSPITQTSKTSGKLPKCSHDTRCLTGWIGRYWALAVPSWICVAVVAAYWAYERCTQRLNALCLAHAQCSMWAQSNYICVDLSWNESLVPPLESLNNIQGGMLCAHLLLHGFSITNVINDDCRCLQQIPCQPGAA